MKTQIRRASKYSIAVFTVFVMLLTGCQATHIRYDYSALENSRPRSILVIPPVNNSVEVNAPYIFLSTISRPLAEKGYYVFPVAVIDRFLKENGLPTPIEMNGIPLDKPLSRVRETAQLVRTMLSGEKTNFDGDTLYSRGYRQAPAENPPPIYIGALRPKMIEMAAEVGDGVIFNLWPQGALPRMMEAVKRGAETAGKNWEDVEIVNRAMVLCTNDKAFGREIFRAAFGEFFSFLDEEKLRNGRILFLCKRKDV